MTTSSLETRGPASPDARTGSWPFAGGGVSDIGANGQSVSEVLAPAGPDEVVARVDAVCVCSSDVKIIRMGVRHPLFNARDLAVSPVVLGHEVALTVVDVGRDWRGRYRPGQRLGLQPAMMIGGKRLTIGIDLPGGFAKHMRLDRRMLDEANPYVFPIPDDLSAAAAAMLEPYSCVEAAYRPNCRIAPKSGGAMLIVGRPGGEAATLTLDCAPARAVLVDAPAELERWARRHATEVETAASLETVDAAVRFDDIIVCGHATAADIAAQLSRVAVGGLFALIDSAADATLAPVDAARIHYHAVSLVGAPGPAVEEAFDPVRNRFEFSRGGAALIIGAGGAMGRIHVHRALDMENGPALIIATSRKGRRLRALENDFAPLADRRGKRLVVVEDGALAAAAYDHAPGGFDDVVVVAPEMAAVARGAHFMRPDGMLVIFSGMPFGEACALPVGLTARSGARFTGSTGSLVEDQLAVIKRIHERGLDLTVNLEAVAGFGALPQALEAVMQGRVCGKVAIYPAASVAPLVPIRELGAEGRGWTLDDERRFAGA